MILAGFIILAYLWVTLLGMCGLGNRPTGPNWFDIIASQVNPTNRAARRTRR